MTTKILFCPFCNKQEVHDIEYIGVQELKNKPIVVCKGFCKHCKATKHPIYPHFVSLPIQDYYHLIIKK